MYRMRKMLFFACLLFCANHIAFSQGDKSLIEKVIRTYVDESKPYLKKLSESEYSGNPKDARRQESIIARYNALEAQAYLIEKKVKKELENTKEIKNKQSISKLVLTHYQKNFPKLPKEYWEIVSKKISNL